VAEGGNNIPFIVSGGFAMDHGEEDTVSKIELARFWTFHAGFIESLVPNVERRRIEWYIGCWRFVTLPTIGSFLR
jgi:hypothetical protein